MQQTAIKQRRNTSIFIVLTLLGLFGALYPLITWIVVSRNNSNESHEQLVANYYSHLPSFLKPGHMDAYVMLLSSVLAVVSAAIWTRRSVHFEKATAIAILVIACLLLAMSLFQLM